MEVRNTRRSSRTHFWVLRSITIYILFSVSGEVLLRALRGVRVRSLHVPRASRPRSGAVRRGGRQVQGQRRRAARRLPFEGGTHRGARRGPRALRGDHPNDGGTHSRERHRVDSGLRLSKDGHSCSLTFLSATLFNPFDSFLFKPNCNPVQDICYAYIIVLIVCVFKSHCTPAEFNTTAVIKLKTLSQF